MISGTNNPTKIRIIKEHFYITDVIAFIVFQFLLILLSIIFYILGSIFSQYIAQICVALTYAFMTFAVLYLIYLDFQHAFIKCKKAYKRINKRNIDINSIVIIKRSTCMLHCIVEDIIYTSSGRLLITCKIMQVVERNDSPFAAIRTKTQSDTLRLYADNDEFDDIIIQVTNK